jgi:hypothetical protein
MEAPAGVAAKGPVVRVSRALVVPAVRLSL